VYQWSDEQLMIRDAVRDFVEKEIAPRREELEHGDLPPYDTIRKLFATFGIDQMARDNFAKQVAREREAAESGEPASSRPSRSGSAFGDVGTAFALYGELCRVSPGMIGSIGVSMGLAAGTIMAKGSLEQKERWAGDLLSLDKVGAWAITEPDSGSDAFGGMRSTVRRDGDEYVLNGEKTFITNGPYADTIVVYAKLDESDGTDPRQRPILTFVLDSGMPGLTQSKPFRKMGFHSSPTGQLFFEDVRLGEDRLLAGGAGSETGGGDAGRESARSNFVMERVGMAAMSLGVIEECLRLSVDFAKSRMLWGKPIGDLQLIQLKLATMEVARINVQNMVFRTIEMARAGKAPSLGEASAMKLYSTQAAFDVAMEAVQLFGGNGYMAEYRVEQLARDAKSFMIYAGSNEVQVTHVAKGLLSGT